jgi:hypothetical protein
MLSGAGNYDTVFSNAITTTTGHDGAQTRALHLDVNAKPVDYTQSPLLFQPTSEPGDFYMSAWMKLPDNLWSQLGSGGWFAPLPEWKSAGDFRVVNSITALGNGQLAWNMQWDSNANGNIPPQTFWHGENTSVPVPQGQWFKVEFFSHRGDSDGRTWLKVNGQTVLDHTGDNIGANNAPVNRVFLGNPYANKPIDVWLDDVQIWDGVPSAPAPAPAPSPAPSGKTITGTLGNDTLIGTDGSDVMTGGGGYDIFVFDSSSVHTGGIDKITDFNPYDDTIDLGFAFTSPTNGALQASEFRIGASALDGNDYVIYNRSSGALYYDPDGSGATAQVQIAKLATNLNLSQGDFAVY